MYGSLTYCGAAIRGPWLSRLMTMLVAGADIPATARQLCVRCGAQTREEQQWMRALLWELLTNGTVAYDVHSAGYVLTPAGKALLCP